MTAQPIDPEKGGRDDVVPQYVEDAISDVLHAASWWYGYAQGSTGHGFQDKSLEERKSDATKATNALTAAVRRYAASRASREVVRDAASKLLAHFDARHSNCWGCGWHMGHATKCVVLALRAALAPPAPVEARAADVLRPLTEAERAAFVPISRDEIDKALREGKAESMEPDCEAHTVEQLADEQRAWNSLAHRAESITLGGTTWLKQPAPVETSGGKCGTCGSATPLFAFYRDHEGSRAYADGGTDDSLPITPGWSKCADVFHGIYAARPRATGDAAREAFTKAALSHCEYEITSAFGHEQGEYVRRRSAMLDAYRALPAPSHEEK